MNDELTTRLREQLHDQVDDLDGPPLTLESVRGRAHAIRRTRRMAVAGAAAVAVAAIVVPTTLLGDATGRSDRSPQPAQPVETPSVIGTGSPLGVPYLEGRTLLMPTGSQARLPKPYRDVEVLGDQVLGLRPDGYLDVVDVDGDVVESVQVDSGFVRNAAGDAVAYSSGGELVVRWADGQVDLGEVGGVTLVALLGGPDCTLGVEDCVVYYESGGSARFVNSSGEGAEVDGDHLKLHDASVDGRVAVLTSVDDMEPGSCGAVRDWRENEPVLETCDHTLSRFAPDGSAISAYPPYLSGIGPSAVSILDVETGEELGTFAPENGFVSTSVWEDPEHLLAVVHDGGAGEWSVIRLGVDGRVETALGPVAGDEMEPPWQLVGAR